MEIRTLLNYIIKRKKMLYNIINKWCKEAADKIPDPE